jgi:hypothetical protein
MQPVHAYDTVVAPAVSKKSNHQFHQGVIAAGEGMEQQRKKGDKEFGGQGQLCNRWCNEWSLQNKQSQHMTFAK